MFIPADLGFGGGHAGNRFVAPWQLLCGAVLLVHPTILARKELRTPRRMEAQRKLKTRTASQEKPIQRIPDPMNGPTAERREAT